MFCFNVYHIDKKYWLEYYVDETNVSIDINHVWSIKMQGIYNNYNNYIN